LKFYSFNIFDYKEEKCAEKREESGNPT